MSDHRHFERSDRSPGSSSVAEFGDPSLRSG